MITETMKEKVMFGKKATQRDETSSNSTLYYSEKEYLTRMIRVGNDFSVFKSNYQKVDFSEQKRMNMCRQLNKMIGGC